ncbi:MAG: hypothetical protein QOD84_877 [Acidobacteriaceae bacterium]
MTFNKRWDLIADGVLWRQALKAFPDDPEMVAMAETLVMGLQENADRTDSIEFVVYDLIAANYLRSIGIAQYQTALVCREKERLREFAAGRNAINQELFVACGNVPPGGVMDTCVKVETMLDNQKLKNLNFLSKRDKSKREKGAKSGQSSLRMQESNE